VRSSRGRHGSTEISALRACRPTCRPIPPGGGDPSSGTAAEARSRRAMAAWARAFAKQLVQLTWWVGAGLQGPPLSLAGVVVGCRQRSRGDPMHVRRPSCRQWTCVSNHMQQRRCETKRRTKSAFRMEKKSDNSRERNMRRLERERDGHGCLDACRYMLWDHVTL
jgi:hypothetical protein